MARFVAQLNPHVDFFHPDILIPVGRAPGQLYVMGDNTNGKQLLRCPLATATFVAAQPDPEPNLTIWNLAVNETEEDVLITWPIETVMPSTSALEYAAAHILLTNNIHQQWAAYVAGVLVVLQRERGLHFAQGLHLFIALDLPAGHEFGSSAALSIATMQVVCAVCDLLLNGHEIALLCQKVEHEVVGTSASRADQIIAIDGEQNRLTVLNRQSAAHPTSLALPSDLALWRITVGAHLADHEMIRVAALWGIISWLIWHIQM
ncbi:MAG: hypothetical protein GFH27_549281n397 [Chloroflexi bacterium AL-W]|nr:hypothetical protein [Chloroflexi bacterium AL-N1]NOK66283.1 hypothetical protein [Chloroflexi bacterium AL-N10]NOK73163.1 hypothetical protein [Chloroflexi bacterium AL-N5]NOK80060.1 hypothetical protein [Chloroflexi bacterium AL-W]NOK88085.1 hypothetical protein [Chloroflexi bacterium AL-N15]